MWAALQLFRGKALKFSVDEGIPDPAVGVSKYVLISSSLNKSFSFFYSPPLVAVLHDGSKTLVGMQVRVENFDICYAGILHLERYDH